MNYDQFLISLCLWREARGSSAQAMTGVMHVILNRAKDNQNRWPKDIHKVILQKLQFSSFNRDDPNSSKFPIDDGGADWKAWKQAEEVAFRSLGDDPTRGANHYHSEMPIPPKWANPDKLTVEIGPFSFYKL
jgi:spore germination cell wall hydrolase CwlJ-like protein